MSKETRKQDGIMFQQTFNLQFPLTQQLSLDLDVPEELLKYWRTPLNVRYELLNYTKAPL